MILFQLKVWRENSPAWLIEGFPEYIAQKVYQQKGWSYFDVFTRTTFNNIDSACKEDLKNEHGKYVLSYIGKRSRVSELMGKDRRLYAPAFYHCSCSLVKYLVEQKGFRPVLNSFSAAPYVQQELEKSITPPVDMLKKSWLEKLQNQQQ